MKLISNPRHATVLIGAAACLAAYVANQQVSQFLLSHTPIYGGTPTVPQARLNDLQQLYPLLAIPRPPTPSPRAQTTGTTPQTLDELFGRSPPVKTEPSVSTYRPPEAIDYFAALEKTKNKNIRLDGLSPRVGAIINGKFIAVGGQIDSLAYPADASQTRLIVPRLTAVTNVGVAIREPHGTRTIIVTLHHNRP